MKQDYEDALRVTLPRRSYCVIRIDGRGFHTFTRESGAPLFAAAGRCFGFGRGGVLCGDMIGCRFAYGQSDDIRFC